MSNIKSMSVSELRTVLEESGHSSKGLKKKDGSYK